MLVTHIVRGNAIAWTATFLDVDQAPVEPEAVEITLNFMNASGGRTTVTAAMDNLGGGSWTFVWDSSVAFRGKMDWSVRAHDPPAADQGSIMLDTNLANPDPVA
jgi:hypothetical protein